MNRELEREALFRDWCKRHDQRTDISDSKDMFEDAYSLGRQAALSTEAQPPADTVTLGREEFTAKMAADVAWDETYKQVNAKTGAIAEAATIAHAVKNRILNAIDSARTGMESPHASVEE